MASVSDANGCAVTILICMYTNDSIQNINFNFIIVMQYVLLIAIKDTINSILQNILTAKR